MRQNRPFPPVRRQPVPEPEPPPTRLERLRRRLGRFYTRFHDLLLIGAGVLIALVALTLYDATKPPPQRLTQRDINAAVARALASATPSPSHGSLVYEIIRPSLVGVRALVSKTEVALGTGFVVEDSGTLVASLHIVGDAAEVQVVFADGTETEALVVAKAPEYDIALLRPRIIPDDLMPATIASSDGLQIGDEVFTAGYPFGLGSSLSAGVVSGFGREYRVPRTGQKLTKLIQFDAAVNPGNWGGPLLNRDGEVVGIVAGLLNPTEQGVFIGIGLAVPIEATGGAMGSPPY